MMSWRWWLLASGLQGEKIQEEGISAYVDCVPIYIHIYTHIYILEKEMATHSCLENPVNKVAWWA